MCVCVCVRARACVCVCALKAGNNYICEKKAALASVKNFQSVYMAFVINVMDGHIALVVKCILNTC